VAGGSSATGSTSAPSLSSPRGPSGRAVDSPSVSGPPDSSPEPRSIDSTAGELVPLHGEHVAQVRPLPSPLEAPLLPIDRPPVSLPATIAAATGGFLLGVATFLLVRVLRRPSAARGLARRRGRIVAGRRGLEVQSTRSFLVDVHQLKR
jgi:hypothetical protein